MNGTRRLGTAVAVTTVLALGGCGGDDTGTADEAGTAGAGTTEVTLVAESIAFDRTELSVPAGQEVTITLDNRDTVQHNLRVLGLDDEVATDIETGPVEQTLSFTVSDPGDYTFQCDVHPSQMTGTLTAS